LISTQTDKFFFKKEGYGIVISCQENAENCPLKTIKTCKPICQRMFICRRGAYRGLRIEGVQIIPDHTKKWSKAN